MGLMGDRPRALAVGSLSVNERLVVSLLEGVKRLEVWVGGGHHMFVTRGFPVAWLPLLDHCGR